MLEVITLLEVQIMGMGGVTLTNLNLCLRLFFYSFATNFDKSLLPLFGPSVGSNKRVLVWV